MSSNTDKTSDSLCDGMTNLSVNSSTPTSRSANSKKREAAKKRKARGSQDVKNSPAVSTPASLNASSASAEKLYATSTPLGVTPKRPAFSHSSNSKGQSSSSSFNSSRLSTPLGLTPKPPVFSHSSNSKGQSSSSSLNSSRLSTPLGLTPKPPVSGHSFNCSMLSSESSPVAAANSSIISIAKFNEIESLLKTSIVKIYKLVMEWFSAVSKCMPAMEEYATEMLDSVEDVLSTCSNCALSEQAIERSLRRMDEIKLEMDKVCSNVTADDNVRSSNIKVGSLFSNYIVDAICRFSNVTASETQRKRKIIKEFCNKNHSALGEEEREMLYNELMASFLLNGNLQKNCALLKQFKRISTNNISYRGVRRIMWLDKTNPTKGLETNPAEGLESSHERLLKPGSEKTQPDLEIEAATRVVLRPRADSQLPLTAKLRKRIELLIRKNHQMLRRGSSLCTSFDGSHCIVEVEVENEQGEWFQVFPFTDIAFLGPVSEEEEMVAYDDLLVPLFNSIESFFGEHQRRPTDEEHQRRPTDEDSRGFSHQRRPTDEDSRGFSMKPKWSGRALITCGSGNGKSLLLATLRRKYRTVSCRPDDPDDLEDLPHQLDRRSPCLLLLDDADKVKVLQQKLQHLHLHPALVMVVATSESASVAWSELAESRLDVCLHLPPLDVTRRRSILEHHNGVMKCSPAELEQLSVQSSGATARLLQEIVLTVIVARERAKLNDLPPPDVVAEAIAEHRAQLSKDSTITAGPRKAAPLLGYQKQFLLLRAKFASCLKYEGVGCEVPSRALLYGPPGCGKNTLVYEVARSLGLPVREVTRADIFSKYYGETDVRMENILTEACAAAPILLLFPEFEGLCSSSSSHQHEAERRLINTLKMKLMGVYKMKGVLVVAKTTRPERLDHTVVRRGRFNTHIHMDLPSLDDRAALFRHQLEQCASEEHLRRLAEMTVGYTGAEVVQVSREVLEEGTNSLEKCVAAVVRGVQEEHLRGYQEFQARMTRNKR